MNNRRKYLRTDMASELEKPDRDDLLEGIDIKEEKAEEFDICRVEIKDERAEKYFKKPKGKYVSINVGKLWLKDDNSYQAALRIVSNELRAMINTVVSKPSSALAVGLGNRFLVSDAVGPLSVGGLTANRHIKETSPDIFESLNSLCLSALTPGVTAQTGMEAAELVISAVKAVLPSFVICVDALASQDVSRLCTSIQISNTGISPGSGIGNRRRAIDKDILGVPVISVGIPTVVDSSTLVFEMLERAGISDISPSLEKELENGRSFFVTLKDADTAVNEMSGFIASVVSEALRVES